MPRRISTILAFAAIISSLLVSACGPNEGVLRSGKGNAVAANSAVKQSSLESDVEAMQTANFEFIYVIRRKDGGEIDPVDRGLLKVLTEGVNRRISSDNGRAFVIGSNSAVPADKMTTLYDKFAVEDHSPPAIPVVNGNVDGK